MNHETHIPQEVIAFLKGLYNDEHDLEQVRQDLVSDYHTSYGFEQLVQAVHAQCIMVDVEEHTEGYITISENMDTDSWTCNNRIEIAKKWMNILVRKTEVTETRLPVALTVMPRFETCSSESA